MILHPDRYNNGALVRKQGVVVHTSESNDDTHDVLIRLLRQPGDRWVDPNDHSKGKYGSGYTAVTDGEGGYTRVADPGVAPFHAPPLNYTWAGVCIPGRAAQTRAEWLDEASTAHIRGVAKFIVDEWRAALHSWPLELRSVNELLAGGKGYTSHNNVGLAWKRTNHTDPGKNFPWDVLAEFINDIVEPKPEPPNPPTPPEEDDVKYVFYKVASPPAIFGGLSYGPQFPALQIEWLKDDERINALRSVGAIDYPVNHPTQALTRGSFKYATLLGDVPQGWAASDFATHLPAG